MEELFEEHRKRTVGNSGKLETKEDLQAEVKRLQLLLEDQNDLILDYRSSIDDLQHVADARGKSLVKRKQANWKLRQIIKNNNLNVVNELLKN